MEYILSYVNDSEPVRYELIYNSSSRLIKPSINSSHERNESLIHQRLAACALVCTHWANYFRPLLLDHRLRMISSFNQMRSVKTMMGWGGTKHIASLRVYTAKNNLFPKVVIVLHTYNESTRPWLHHLGISNIHCDDCQLYIGSAGYTAYYEDRALWESHVCRFLPKTLLPAGFHPFTELTIQGIDLPSIDTLLRFLRQFSSARKLTLHRIYIRRMKPRNASFWPISSRHSRSRPIEVSVQYVSADYEEKPLDYDRRDFNAYALCKAIIFSLYPELPICSLPFLDGLIAQRLFTKYMYAEEYPEDVRFRMVWGKACFIGLWVASLTDHYLRRWNRGYSMHPEPLKTWINHFTHMSQHINSCACPN